MRLKTPDYDRMDEDQKAVHDRIASGPRGTVPTPLAIWLYRPRLAEAAETLGAYCRYRTLLGPVLSELAILVMARFWSAEYEWYVHKGIALKAGLPPVVVDAIRRHRRPVFADESQEIVHDFAREVLENRNVSDATYARAVELLGSDCVVDLVGLLGYYTLISMTIRVFETPLPDGVEPELGPAAG